MVMVRACFYDKIACSGGVDYYNPLCREVVEDFRDLCTEIIGDRLQDEPWNPDAGWMFRYRRAAILYLFR